MTNFRGTPGPWYAHNLGGYFQINDGNFYESNNILDSEDVGQPIANANAKLCTKAPDMLAMLENYLSDLRNIVPESQARNSRIADVEELIKSATEL